MWDDKQIVIETKVIDFWMCLQLPTLGKLTSLKTLRISNMLHVKYLYEES
uniref:Uncharacterized protein n=1 Tax=Cajanus cajan TaxID=3821 RepID=A0A151TFG7_CAJCA|nr:hypothetical protein KK1_012046 [Cajanus cajan]